MRPRADDPCPAVELSRSVIAPGDLSEAFALALDLSCACVGTIPSGIASALDLDGEHHADLESDLDAFTGAER